MSHYCSSNNRRPPRQNFKFLDIYNIFAIKVINIGLPSFCSIPFCVFASQLMKNQLVLVISWYRLIYLAVVVVVKVVVVICRFTLFRFQTISSFFLASTLSTCSRTVRSLLRLRSINFSILFNEIDFVGRRRNLKVKQTEENDDLVKVTFRKTYFKY